jgi:predicted nucleotidyltransferase
LFNQHKFIVKTSLNLKNNYLCGNILEIKPEMKRPEIVNRLREIIRAVAPDAKVILYGSEARGDARPDSDIDLLILLDKEKVTYTDQIQLSGPLYDLELSSGVLISSMIISRKSWENRPFKTPFFVNVMNEGILI